MSNTELVVPHLASHPFAPPGSDDAGISSAVEAFKSAAAPFAISSATWEGFGFEAGLPQVHGWIAHSGGHIHYFFEVTEKDVRGTETRMHKQVFRDSCVEFFLELPGGPRKGGYYNLETNILGTPLFYYGVDREDRLPLVHHRVAQVQCFGSHVGREPFGIVEGVQTWTIGISVPTRSFTHHQIEDLSGIAARGNFYKCGDLLPRPHYLCWSPITTTHPDYHRPEFFAAIHFE